MHQRNTQIHTNHVINGIMEANIIWRIIWQSCFVWTETNTKMRNVSVYLSIHHPSIHPYKLARRPVAALCEFVYDFKLLPARWHCSALGGASEDKLLQQTFSLYRSFCCIAPSHLLDAILPLPAPYLPAPSTLTSSLSPPPSSALFPVLNCFIFSP